MKEGFLQFFSAESLFVVELKDVFQKGVWNNF